MRAACNLAPDPEPSEPSAEPTVITLTTRQAATLIASGSGITRQPPGPKVIISKAFIVYTNPAVRYQTTTILGTSIEVEFVKPRVLWRLVYLVPVVTGCDCSWLFWLTSGTQAASCSAGVRIPIAE